MLATLMLFSLTLFFASCNNADVNETTMFENQESETTTICDQAGHAWGSVPGNPYADSICTVCGYCRHNSGVSTGIYKSIDEKNHAYGDQCYACFELINPITEEHAFVDGYCDFCLQEDPDFVPDNATASCDEVGHTWGTNHPYADSICTVCGYCRHNSGVATGVHRSIDAKYHAYGDLCYACFEFVEPIIEEHNFNDGWCDDCLQEAPDRLCVPSRTQDECDHYFPLYQETLDPYADSICTKCEFCRHNSGVVPNIYLAIDGKYHIFGTQCYACFELFDAVIEEHTFVDGYCDYCFEKEP